MSRIERFDKISVDDMLSTRDIDERRAAGQRMQCFPAEDVLSLCRERKQIDQDLGRCKEWPQLLESAEHLQSGDDAWAADPSRHTKSEPPERLRRAQPERAEAHDAHVPFLRSGLRQAFPCS